MSQQTDVQAWGRISAVLEQAFDLSDEQLAKLLDDTCGGDAHLRAQVESLLLADARADGVLDLPIDELAAPLLAEEEDRAGLLSPGSLIGHYRIVRKIGDGGMGHVYLAERADGQFEQRVALKLIRAGLSWGELRERFLQERQILAGLQHPNMARLLDGGVADDGRPFFVMEFVEGRPITEYVRQEHLALNARLELFIHTCDAVAYAQQRLVVHRDLKPSNILVSADGEVKLLDFGIARLLGTGREEGLTQTGPRMLTPEYAAPEQVLGGTITTATDVYALGKVLSELLDTSAEPDSGHRSGRGLPRDLMNVAAKASAEDSDLRYATAADLAEDLRRFLAGLPIGARRPTLRYRAHRFIARNRLAAAASAAVTASLLIGLMLTSWQAERAKHSALRATQVTEFLVSLFDEADPDLEQGTQTTAAELLRRGAARIESELSTEPDLQAELFNVIGLIQIKRGDYADAAVSHERALKLLLALHEPDHPSVAETLSGLGEAHLWLSKYEMAHSAFSRALEIQRQRRAGNTLTLARAISNLATVNGRLGAFVEAEALYREALEISRAAFGRNHLEVAGNLGNLAVFLGGQARYEEAEAVHFEALEILRENLPEQHTEIALSLHNIGHLYFDSGDLENAERYLRQAVEMRRSLHQGPHPRLASSLRVLGMAVRAQDRLEEASRLFEESIGVSRSHFGDNHVDVASGLNDMGVIAFMRGDLQAARAWFTEALSIFSRLLPENHPTILTLKQNIGRIALEVGDLDAAERAYTEVLEAQRTKLGDEHRDIGASYYGMATIHIRREAWTDAHDALQQALLIYRTSLDESSEFIGAAKTLFGRVLGELGRSEEAENVLRETLRTFQSELPAGHRRIVDSSLELGRLLGRTGRPAEALPLLEFAAQGRRESYGNLDGRTGDALAALGVCLQSLGRSQDARTVLQEAVTILRNSRGPKDFETRRAEAALATLAAT